MRVRLLCYAKTPFNCSAKERRGYLVCNKCGKKFDLYPWKRK